MTTLQFHCVSPRRFSGFNPSYWISKVTLEHGPQGQGQKRPNWQQPPSMVTRSRPSWSCGTGLTDVFRENRGFKNQEKKKHGRMIIFLGGWKLENPGKKLNVPWHERPNCSKCRDQPHGRLECRWYLAPSIKDDWSSNLRVVSIQVAKRDRFMSCQEACCSPGLVQLESRSTRIPLHTRNKKHGHQMEGSADSAFCNDMFHFNLLLVKRRWGLTESRSPCHFAETTKLQEVHIPRCTVRAALFQLPCQTICLLHGVKDVTTLSRMTVGGRESFFLGRTSLWWKKSHKTSTTFWRTRSSPTIHHSIPSKTQDQQNMSEYQQQTFEKKKRTAVRSFRKATC